MKTFRVCYIPQVPGKPLEILASNLDEARLVGQSLVALSKFEFENDIKPDYSDVLFLETLENGEWSEWIDGEGDDFNFFFK